MPGSIGIRREDKNIWERRVPLSPKHVGLLNKQYGIQTLLQPFNARAFSDQEYVSVGAQINEDLSPCQVVLAVKEIPINYFSPNTTFLFFSHTIKGQAHNVPMLQKLLDLKCTLIDYECIRDNSGKRLVFFGDFAGLAGMIDTLHIFGQRLRWLGMTTPFLKIRHAHEYRDLEDAKAHIRTVAAEIEEKGIPSSLLPLVFGFTGYGHVSNGAQKVLDLLPTKEIAPEQLLTLRNANPRQLFKVVFKEKDMVEPADGSSPFDLIDYYSHPEKYRSRFGQYIPFLSVLINGIYWDKRYPRLVTKEYLRFVSKKKGSSKLQVIADISCDIHGSIECTEKVTEPGHPAFVYNPATDRIVDGFAGEGVAVIAVDNLPAELPRDASIAFSEALWRFVPQILAADFSLPFEPCQLPEEIKKAVIVYKGELTPRYEYLKQYL